MGERGERGAETLSSESESSPADLLDQLSHRTLTLISPRLIQQIFLHSSHVQNSFTQYEYFVEMPQCKQQLLPIFNPSWVYKYQNARKFNIGSW